MTARNNKNYDVDRPAEHRVVGVDERDARDDSDHEDAEPEDKRAIVIPSIDAGEETRAPDTRF